jgi:putative sigma-54 modulation protein
MKITYTGRQVELAPAQIRKLEAQCAKIGKLLDGKGDCEAHVILSHERHLQRAEVTAHYHDHPLVGIATDPDLFTAIHAAIGKLEKQAIKVRAKWRDTKRTPWKNMAEPVEAAPPPVETAAQKKSAKRKVFRVNHSDSRKPMTLEEAVMEMEKDGDYLVYRDAGTDGLSVLIRRPDGNFDLIES